MSPKLGPRVDGRDVPFGWVSPVACIESEALSFNLLYDGFRGIPVDVVAGIRCGEFDEAILAVLVSELEKPESRDVLCDFVPSVPQSSSKDLCSSSTLLGTARMVEFMRLGVIRRDKGEEEAGAREMAFALASLVATLDIAELRMPSDAGARVDRGEGCSCTDLGALAGVALVGVAAGAVAVGTTVTDEESWGAHC